MGTKWIIIDGYNALHTQNHLKSLFSSNPEKARYEFIKLIENYLIKLSCKTTVIFDGIKKEIDPILSTKSIEVIYAPSNLSADGLIERLVHNYTFPKDICVVTSDRLEQLTVTASGAFIQSSKDFMNQCLKTKSSTYSTKMKPLEKPTIGDIFPNKNEQ